MRWLVGAAIAGVLLGSGGLRAASWDRVGGPARDSAASPLPAASAGPLISKIEFVGLRYIAPGAAEAQISSHAGEQLDAGRVESDVKALGRLGWFSDVRAETQPATEAPWLAGENCSYVRLVFVVEELPFLARVEFAGSRLLSGAQIAKMLADQKLTPKLGEPAAPENLARVSRAIRSALAELGHPQVRVQIQQSLDANGTARAQFVIEDGPHIPVGRVEFEGESGVPAKLLRHEMRRTAPGAFFASWRGKGAFTRGGFEEDRSRILIWYQNHGFPEARVGNARVAAYKKKVNRWLPWRRGKIEQRLSVKVPTEAGPDYRIESIEVSRGLANASGRRGAKLLAFSKSQGGTVYSVERTEDLRHAWAAALQPKHQSEDAEHSRSVALSRTFDPQAHTVRVRIGFGGAPPYVVRRIEFSGLHRFSDRYLRRRIGLMEGQPFDERALEAGLARLARTGYFHQIKKEDIQVRTDEMTHAADVTIRVSEAGQQRASFSGEQGQFGSTLGVAYSVFDLLQREELLSTQLDAGPDSLQVVLGLMVEGFLGSRSSLAFSIFNDILRPRLKAPVKGPFISSQSDGLNWRWSYPLTNTDSLAVNYALSRTKTDYSLVVPAALASLPANGVHAETSGSGVGLGWTHDTGSERWSVANSVSGGLFGGTENVIRSNEEYAHMFADPAFNHQNAWAFRATLSGAGSYSGDMPIYARLFSGDAQVRGLSPGELGPYAVVPPSSVGSGRSTYTALPAGANVVTAANAEYRVPLGNGVQGAGFFDLGSGWMFPNWLGQTRPTLLNTTNGILHGSVGFELRWTVPGIQVPVRAYYAVNVIRLNRFLALPDGTLLHAHNRLLAFGWALGTLF